MAIKRYLASKDNTITNAFKIDLLTRGTGSNMGASDILETFSIYGQQTTSSAELSRILIEFPIEKISSDRGDNNIPASGSVKFYLRMFNARHSEQLPRNFTLNVLAVSSSWQEGHGLDMEGYTDETKDGIDGSNWLNGTNNFASATTNLVLQGGANLAAMDAQTFVLTDANGVSQTFTFDFDGSVNSAGTIGFTGDSNTTQAIDSIKTAINNVSALAITAGTAVATGDADSEMTLPLTQDNTGYSGNTTVDVSGVAHLTAQDFSGGAGKWVTIGGDYHDSAYIAAKTMPNYTQNFADGDEDILLDVTSAVEEWIAGSQTNNGFGVFLTSSQEAHVTASDVHLVQNTSGQQKSFYTKRFFSRTSEFFFKRPVIEARWDSRTSDDRGNFYSSSSIAPASDNINNLYLYNYIRGSLKDIPHTETIKVNLYASHDDSPSGPSLANATATKQSTGIYKAQVFLDTTSSILHDVWSGSIGGEYKTGSILVKDFNDSSVLVSNDYRQFTTKITNLKPSYSKEEKARFRVFTRPRDFSPTIHTIASNEIQGVIIPSSSYEVLRMADGETIFNHSTSSADYHTYLSYDNSGSYFDFDMSLLQPGYLYAFKFAYYSSGDWREQKEIFKFRVEKN